MDSFKGKKILVFGLGLNQGGVGSALFFAKKGAEVKVTDLKSAEILQSSIDLLKDFPNITFTLGEHKNEDIDWADLIIKNPGVKPGNPYIEYAERLGKRVEMDMGIFLEYVKPSQLIGVTGTKGKSTTSNLIYKVLKDAGKEVIFAGNIGKSVFDIIDQINSDTLVVLELSSFQLESFKKHQTSPKYAIITNIYPDHLNYYKSMDEYVAAKKIIGQYQTPDDFIFINKDDPTISTPEFLKGLKGKIIFYSTRSSAYSKSDLPLDFKPILVGEHNKSNAAAALALGKSFGITEEKILDSIANFPGVPFRMEIIKKWGGLKIINDTTATGPDAAIQALSSFPNSILICGGMNKGMDYHEFAKTVDKYAKKVYFLEGDSTEEIRNLIQNQDLIAGTYNDLEKLLEDIKDFAKPGDTILFSPAATSFNLFQNEFDRGRKFNALVDKLFS